MYKKKLGKLLKKTKPNSGFTLTELLTGLIMSIFVTGALGFGLIQIMSLTRRGTEQTNARNEANRALEFISDEIRRAQTLDDDLSEDLDNDPTTAETNPAVNFPAQAGRNVVLSLNIPEVNNSATLGSDGNANTTERIVYYLEAANDTWQGPLVLYRWGPPLDANGNYTNNTWQSEALIDGISAGDPEDCNGTSTANPGFLACINTDSTSAQIFLTGGVDIDNDGSIDTNGVDKALTASTQTVARAKVANVNNAMATPEDAIAFRSLEADYTCDPRDIDAAGNPKTWTMRMDFDNSADGVDGRGSAVKWIHEPGRQPQPININSDNDLTIYALPIEATGCLNADSGNEGASESQPLGDFVNEDGSNVTDAHAVSHTIKFDVLSTFNGDTEADPENTDNRNNPNVDPTGKVVVLKNGSKLKEGATIDTTSERADAPLYLGYDFDGDGSPDRPSLGRFLFNKGFAVPLHSSGTAYTNNEQEAFKNAGNTDPDGGYEIIGLDPKERIVAMEIGKDDNGTTGYDPNGDEEPHPGFDLQDNVILMRHDIFDNPD